MEILIPITLFAMIAAIVIAPRYFKSLERQKLQDTLRAAYENGQSVPPELIESMAKEAKSPPGPHSDLRTGIIWLGVAAGFVGMALAMNWFDDGADATLPLLGIAAFPGFIGLAFIVLSALNASRRPKA
jgi:hypothetical protein